MRSWPTEFVFLPVLPLEAILREFDHALDRICRLNLMIFFYPSFFPMSFECLNEKKKIKDKPKTCEAADVIFVRLITLSPK